MVSKTPVWETGCMTVRTASVDGFPRALRAGGAPTRERSSPGRPFGIYIHVPFCATRCGYCDFNTYTPAELGGANPDGWLEALRAELGLAASLLGSAPSVSTIFVGGGTPSLLGGDGLGSVLDAVRAHFPPAADAEVTTEANPESTSPRLFDQLRTAGFTRVSLGMQSVAPHVLAVLNRTHSPGRALDAAREARAAGFDHVNLDLIYGTPGESDDDLRRSVDVAIDAGVDHVSGYALVVEDGTALARRVRRGEVAAPDDDVLAQRYELLDARLSAAGFDWYEVSNWSRPGGECLQARALVVDGGGEFVSVVDFHFGAEAHADAVCELAHLRFDRLLHLRPVAARITFECDGLGQHVARAVGQDLGDRDDGGVEGRDPARHNRL